MTKLKLRSLILCIIIIGLLSTTVFAASIEKNIKVVYNNIKLYVDGNLVIPKDSNGNIIEPFIYNGTTYLPVRAVADALGETVRWDGSTNSVYIGENPEGQFMSDIIEPYNSDGILYDINETMVMGGNKYYKGFSFGIWGTHTPRSGEIFFNLNSKFTEITSLLGYEDNEGYKSDIVIRGDDNILFDHTILKGDLPKDIKINVKGVNKLSIKITNYSSGMGRNINFANLIIK